MSDKTISSDTASDRPKPPARRLRLRTMVVLLVSALVLLLAASLAHRVYRARRQHDARLALAALQETRYSQAKKEMSADALMNLNYIVFDWQADLLDKHVTDDGAFHHPPTREWLGELLGVDFFHDVVRVSIDWAKEGDLRPVRDLPGLRKLFVRGRISDDDLGNLDAMGQLEELTLMGAHISDAGAQRLGRLTTLRFLSLVGTGVSAGAVDKLQAKLPGCKIVR